MNDKLLAKKILSQDRGALWRFYKSYTPSLARFISARVKNPKDSDEILQDTLFSFLEALRDYEGRSSLKTFLYSIGRNKIADFYRKKKVKHIVFSQFPGLEFLVSPLLTPEDELDSKIYREKIRCVLQKILPKYKSVLLLKYLDNYSVAEIAERFSITPKSAESMLFRARKAFVKVFVET